MDSRDDIKPLSGIGTQVYTLRAVIGFQIAVLDDLPFMPPDFTILLIVPVNRIFFMAFPPAGRKFDPFPVLIKVINLAALGKPFPMFVHCPHSEHDMGVGIVSRRMGVCLLYTSPFPVPPCRAGDFFFLQQSADIVRRDRMNR